MAPHNYHEVLRGFLLGGASGAELQEVVDRFEVIGTETVLRGISQSRSRYDGLRFDIRNVARELALFLKGRVKRQSLSRWVDALNELATSPDFQAWSGISRGMATSLGILSLLLDGGYPAPPHRLRRSLERIHRWLDAGKPVLARRFLPGVFRDMGCLELRPLENPFEFLTSSQEQWVDVGLTIPASGTFCDGRSGKALRVIPFSVFTRTFFRRDLPVLLSLLAQDGLLDRTRADEFYYHPENNQAVSLRERFSHLRGASPDFQYYVDQDGLAEIVLDAPTICRNQLRFAARLFCLQNGVRRATLDGVRVSGTVMPLR